MQNYCFCHLSVTAMTCKYTKAIMGFMRKSLNGGHLGYLFKLFGSGCPQLLLNRCIFIQPLLILLLYIYFCDLHVLLLHYCNSLQVLRFKREGNNVDNIYYRQLRSSQFKEYVCVCVWAEWQNTTAIHQSNL